MKKYKNKGFTLIELVVASTILVILTSIWFYSYTENIADARDGVRKTDISALGSQLNLYKKQRWAYPVPGNNFEIHNRWGIVAYQWYMNNSVTLSTADKLPTDPDLEIPYIYATTKNRQEHQLALSLENSGSPYAILLWDYKSVAKNILPNIILAAEGTTALEVNSAVWAWATNRLLFIFDKGSHNIPYDFDTLSPSSDATAFNDLLTDAGDDYWQNSDYRNCSEVYSAAKSITPDWSSDEYQILNSTGALIDQSCDCTSTWCTETP